MGEQNNELELRILSTLPFVVKWIQTDKELTDNDFENLKKLYPEQYKFALNSTLEELIEMNSRHKDSKIYGKHIEILLSPQGIKWLDRNYRKLKNHAQE